MMMMMRMRMMIMAGGRSEKGWVTDEKFWCEQKAMSKYDVTAPLLCFVLGFEHGVPASRYYQSRAARVCLWCKSDNEW